MTDQKNEGAPAERANLPATPAPERKFIQISSPVRMFDTGGFEHMNRVAMAMARASIIPWHLRGTLKIPGKIESLEPFPMETIVGNCLRIVSIADRWEVDPYSLAECTSFVYGRIMFEGKAVAAALDGKLGVKLKYEFGKWNPETETVDLAEEGQGDSLGVVVSGAEPGFDLMTVEGAVGVWKTTGAGSPWRPGAFKRQLRYRGAREWARAHRPGIMLGIYTDDEMADLREDLRLAGPRSNQGGRDSLIERLQAGGGQAPDIVGHVARQTGDSSVTIENDDTQESDADTRPATDGPGEGAADRSVGGSSASTSAKDPPPGTTTDGQKKAGPPEGGKDASKDENRASAEANGEKAPPAEEKKPTPVEKRAAKAKAEKEAAERAEAEKQEQAEAGGAVEPPWLADMSPAHIEVYDSVVERLQKVTAWGEWRQFKKDYRDSAKGIVEDEKSGFPAAARDHLLKMMDSVQEKGGW